MERKFINVSDPALLFKQEFNFAPIIRRPDGRAIGVL
jgi:hypothetical protein